MSAKPDSAILAIPRPCPGESLSSVFDRAGQLYQRNRDSMLWAIVRGRKFDTASEQVDDWDDPPEWVYPHLADALDMDPAVLKEHAIADDAHVTAPQERIAVCYQCFNDDRAEGRVPYFRREWAMLNRTICPKHRAPLCPWPWVDGRGHRLIPRRHMARRRVIELAAIPGTSWRGDRLTEYLLSWESELGAEIMAQGDLTQTQDPITRVLAELLMLFGTLRHEDQRTVMAGMLIPSSVRWVFSRSGTPRQHISEKGTSWDRFRALGNPHERRAVHWLTAGTLNCIHDANLLTGARGVGQPTGGRNWWHFVVWNRCFYGDISYIAELWTRIFNSSGEVRWRDVPPFIKGIARQGIPSSRILDMELIYKRMNEIQIKSCRT